MSTRTITRLLQLTWLALMAGPLHAAEPGEPAVLRFQNRDIVTFRATLGPVTPTERAGAAQRRLAEGSVRDYRRPVTVVPYSETRSVALGDRMIFAIVPDDIDASAGETVDLVAAAAADNLRLALAAWDEQRRPEVIVRGAIHIVIATLLLLLTLIVLRFIRKRFLLLVPSRAERAMSRRRITFFGQDLQGVAIRTIRIVINAAFVLAALMLAYTWLTYSLKQFPFTAPWGDGLAGFLAGTVSMIGLGILNGIPEMIIVVLALYLTRLAANLVASLFDAVERGQVTIRGVHPDTADATRRIAVTLVWIFGIAIAYPFIPGSSSDAFKGISVLVGIMISLGSSGVINQAMSGMVVVFSRALKAGEYVSVADYEGTVTEVGALSTKLRTKRNEEINIPNAMLVSSTTKNYSRLAGEHGVILYSSVGIGYNAPWRIVHRLLVEAALRTPGIKRDPAPFVRQSSLSSFCADYTINAHIENPDDRLAVLSNLNGNIQDAFNEAGIQIMTPAFESQPEEMILVPKSKWNEGGAPADRNT